MIQERLPATNDHNTLGAFLAKPIGTPGPSARCLKMARNPSKRKVYFEELAQNYDAMYFQDAFSDFIAKFNHPAISIAILNN
jgi:hypothetical protein